MARAHQQDVVARVGRAALMALAGASLFAGAWAGLVRLGIVLRPPSPEALAAHGAVMVGGMLGTLIGLERAVALGRRWAFAAPLASGLGGVAALAGADWTLVTGAFVLASLVFVAASAMVAVRQLAAFTLVMLLGAVAWAFGNVAWALGVPVERVVLSWAAFLVLTIAGERLELSRLRAPPPRAVRLFGGLVLGLAAGASLVLFAPALGARIAGGSLGALALWLARHDLARKTVSVAGLPRYAAVSVLSGYVWLAIGGLIFAVTGRLVPGPSHYDAALHALFLGFAFSMVFGHAPIILPAVLRIEIPYSRLLYAPLALLHGSVALRVSADLLALPALRHAAGVLNVAALLAFALSVVVVKLRARALANHKLQARPGATA